MTSTRTTPRAGSALIIVLWTLVLLGVAVMSVLNTTQLDLHVAKNHGDQVQAHYLALAGIEKAKALIHQERLSLREQKLAWSDRLTDAPEQFRDVPLGRGVFRIVREGRQGERQGAVYGIEDESSRVSLNDASREELGAIPGMTAEVAAAIIDWRDADSRVTPGGAEKDYYLELSPPYRVRNAPFETLREVLMVRDVGTEDLLGEDANGNGLLDPNEDDASQSLPRDNGDGALQAGWSTYLSLNTGSSGDALDGEPRVNVKNAAEETLASVEGISAELAKAIAAHNRSNARGIGFLLDVRQVVTTPANGTPQPGQPQPGQPQPGLRRPGQPGSPGNIVMPTPPRNTPQPGVSMQPSRTPPGATPPGQPPAPGSGQQQSTGPKLVNAETLISIADKITTVSGVDLKGTININTAGVDVLTCLSGFDRTIAQATVDYRRRNGYFKNIAELLRVPGISEETFKQMSHRVAAGSTVYRIHAEGEVLSTGARKTIQVVLKVGDSGFETLSYREDL